MAGWCVVEGDFFWSGGKSKKGGEDLPDERVPVDRKEKVMRNEKEGCSKCLEAEYSSMKQQNMRVGIYELDSMLLR
ncbi:hypothetical protein AVEN_96544-1 [Araneus ventricosus]|uniref:Uncharacterized protein n=1 Tax=Araneus ventricosus TaxID=182803 RepID=A0A4Y2UF71_ARAVE|nr:hypothetical protein AVEN_96544-1 [Araneus ventricosus]